MSGSDDTTLGVNLRVETEQALAELHAFLEQGRKLFQKNAKTMKLDEESGRFARELIKQGNTYQRSIKVRLQLERDLARGQGAAQSSASKAAVATYKRMLAEKKAADAAAAAHSKAVAASLAAEQRANEARMLASLRRQADAFERIEAEKTAIAKAAEAARLQRHGDQFRAGVARQYAAMRGQTAERATRLRFQQEYQQLIFDTRDSLPAAIEKEAKRVKEATKESNRELEKRAKERAAAIAKYVAAAKHTANRMWQGAAMVGGGIRDLAMGGLGFAKATGLRSIGTSLHRGVAQAANSMGRFLGTTLRTGQAVHSVWLGLNKWVGRLYMAQRMAWTLRGTFDAIVAPLRLITDVSSQFEEMRIQLSGMFNAMQGPGAQWGDSFAAATKAIDYIAMKAALLPGEAEDYNRALKLASVGMAQHGITNTLKQAEFVARFSGTMQGMGETGTQVAADLQSMMMATVTKRTRSFKLLRGFMYDDAGKRLGTTKAYTAATPEERVQAIENALAHFKPMLDNYSHTMSAQVGTLKTHLQILVRGAGYHVFDGIVTGLEHVNGWLDANADKIVVVGQRVFSALGAAGRRAGEAAQAILTPVQQLAQAVGGRLSGQVGIADSLLGRARGMGMAGALGQAGGVMAPFGGAGAFSSMAQLLGFVDGLTRNAKGLHDFMGQIVVVFRRLRTMGEAAGQFFYRVGYVFADIVKTTFGGLAQRVDEWTAPVVTAFKDTATWIESFWTRHKATLSRLASTFADVATAVGGIFLSAIREVAHALDGNLVTVVDAATSALHWLYDGAVGVYKTFSAIVRDFSGFWHSLKVAAGLEDDPAESPFNAIVEQARAMVLQANPSLNAVEADDRVYSAIRMQLGDLMANLSAVERNMQIIAQDPDAAAAAKGYDRLAVNGAMPENVRQVIKAAYEAERYMAQARKSPYAGGIASRLNVVGDDARNFLDRASDDGDFSPKTWLAGALREVSKQQATLETMNKGRTVDRGQLPPSLPSWDEWKRVRELERVASEKSRALQSEIASAGDSAVGWFRNVGSFFNALFSFNLTDLVSGRELNLSVKDAMKKPKGGGGTTFDFRGSRFNIEQKFAEGFDPDRIATAFSRDIGELAERRTQSNLTGMLGLR